MTSLNFLPIKCLWKKRKIETRLPWSHSNLCHRFIKMSLITHAVKGQPDLSLCKKKKLSNQPQTLEDCFEKLNCNNSNPPAWTEHHFPPQFPWFWPILTATELKNIFIIKELRKTVSLPYHKHEAIKRTSEDIYSQSSANTFHLRIIL